MKKKGKGRRIDPARIQKITEILKKQKATTEKELATTTGYHWSSIRKITEELKTQNKIEIIHDRSPTIKWKKK